jgi:hypothetical protein
MRPGSGDETGAVVRPSFQRYDVRVRIFSFSIAGDDRAATVAAILSVARPLRTIRLSAAGRG